jgi:hypothetical protein
MESGGTLQADVGSSGICKQKRGGGRGAGITFTPLHPTHHTPKIALTQKS